MKKPTKKQKLIYKMLTENTGKHFLDSGGAYGRNWERNQKKKIEDFMNEPEERISFDGSYLYRNVSVFHYLSQLETDEICDKFNRMKVKDWDCEDFYGVSAKQGEYLERLGAKELRTFNTYNGDSDLSQVLQGSFIELFIDGQYEEYLLLQIHGGCDVRGGYTDAKLFKTQYGMIHEYLWEYKGQSELIEDLEYLDVYDYYSGALMDTELVKLRLKLDSEYHKYINNIEEFLEDYSLDDIEKIKKFCFDKYPEISEEIIISELGIKEGVFNLNTIIGEVVKQIESNTLEISYE
jgi:hypothetical protein